jgi:hypothetical protein
MGAVTKKDGNKKPYKFTGVIKMQQQLNDYYQVNEVLDIVKCDLEYHMENDTELEELHQELFNMGYYSHNDYDADKFAGQNWFEILGHVIQYEQDQFGEISTDINDKSKIINMYVYIVGEEIIQHYYNVFETMWHLWATDEKDKARHLIKTFNKYEKYTKTNSLGKPDEMSTLLRVELDMEIGDLVRNN